MNARRLAAPIAVALLLTMTPACSTSTYPEPLCGEPGGHTVVLLAQSVPSATLVPCLRAVPAGWSFTVAEVRDGEARMSLTTATFTGSVDLTFTPSCETGEAVEVVPAPGEEAATVLQAPDSLDPLRGTRYVVFEGGCATAAYSFPTDMPASQALEADRAFSFVPRTDVVAAVAEQDDGAILCGVGAPPCEGA